MDTMYAGVGAPRLLEPSDRLVGARFKQMHFTDLRIPGGQIAMARAEADCVFRVRDYLVHRSDVKLALTKPGMSVREVAIERDCCLVFDTGVLKPRLRAQHLALYVMRPRAIGRHRQGSRDQLICALKVDIGCVAYEMPVHEI